MIRDIRHWSTCPVANESFVWSPLPDGHTHCNCDFGIRLQNELLGVSTMPIGMKPEKENFKEPTMEECLALIAMPETLTSINVRLGRLVELAEQDAERRAKADAQIEEWKAMFKKLSEPLNDPYHGMFVEEPGKGN